MQKNYILTVALAFLANLALAQQSKPVKQLDSVFAMMNAQNQFNGSVLIAEKGKVLLRKGYGYRDLQGHKLNNPQTVFELASCSKQFTAAAIVLLKRWGKIDYQNRLSSYIPELPQAGNITINDLLRHTSGLPEYVIDMQHGWDKTKIATNQDLIHFYSKRKDTLKFASGSKHQYNNTNYVLLAEIISRISGLSYADFLNRHIFKPLHMKHTFVYNQRLAPKKIHNYATGYVWAKNSFTKVTPEHPAYGDDSIYSLDGIVGSAKVNSTVEDLYRWILALKSNTLLTAEEFDLMTTVTQTSKGKNIPYGYGLEISKGNQKFSFGHSGSWGGYASFIYHQVNKDRTIITLQNFKQGAYPFETIFQILDRQPVKIEYREKIQMPEAEVKKYAGTYISNDQGGEEQIISYLEGHLIHNTKKIRWDMRFFPVMANEFQAVRQGGTNGVLRFTPLENGDMKLEMLEYGAIIGTGIRKHSSL